MAESVSIKDVYDRIISMEKKMITREEFEGYLATIEILSNPQTMDSLKGSRQDIKEGKIRKIDGIKDLLKGI